MKRDKSFALYAASKKLTAQHFPVTAYNKKGAHTVFIRAEFHDCHYDQAMDKIAALEGENFINTIPA